jgi:predicted nucleic acid-binding protein
LEDNKFLDAAVAGKVRALISGDRDLLDLKDIEGIPIITMANFLEN